MSSPDPQKTYLAVRRALQGISMDPADWVKVSGFVNREVPALYAGSPSTVVLGSYRPPYNKRLRVAAHELQRRRSGAYSVVVGDTQDPGVDPNLDFRLKLHMLCIYTDYIASVYEKDGGGEINELGKVTDGGYFDKTWVFPRDYPWLSPSDIQSEPDLHAAAAAVYGDDSLSDQEKSDKLDDLINGAKKNGVTATQQEVLDIIKPRLESSPAVGWSWPNCSDFALYRKVSRCYPWATEDNLRKAVRKLPKK